LTQQSEVRVTSVKGPDALRALAGQHVGTSDWIRITSAQLALFGRATSRARRADGEVDGFPVLSHAGALVPTICQVKRRKRGINYGLDRVVFQGRLRVGEQMRVHLGLASATGTDFRVDAVWEIRVEVDRADRPVEVCRARTRTRYLF
jgi:acyl dehydratase